MSEAKAKVTVISIPEAKEVLKSIEPEKADQIQKRAQDYLEKFSRSDSATAKRMRATLVKECALTEWEATEIVNVAPSTVEEIRVFSAGWKKLLTAETVEKILKILQTQA